MTKGDLLSFAVAFALTALIGAAAAVFSGDSPVRGSLGSTGALLGALLLLSVHVVVGGAAGWGLARFFRSDPEPWAVAGAAVGLILFGLAAV